jgi:hypothetical protein
MAERSKKQGIAFAQFTIATGENI